MQRAGRLLVIGLVALGVGLTALAVHLRRERAPRSVVLVTIDTLRADRVGAFGSTAGLTPRLDALAARGVRFTECWTTAPLTVPAHASMLTGLIPPLHGLRTNSGGRLPEPGARPYSTVAELLRTAGYRTGAFVSASVLRDDRTGLGSGFDVYDEPPPAAPGSLHDSERLGTETVAAALDWVRQADGDFLLWVHLFDPHAPYAPPEPYSVGEEHSADATGYDAEVRFADHALGQLLDGLAAAGHGDAAIVVASDHGEGLGQHGERTHGYLLHQATLHVPVVIAAPGRVGEGAQRDEPSSVIDLAPTLVSLADVSIPPTMDGRPLFAGGAERMRRAPYAESLYGWDACRWAQVFALRDGDLKAVDAGERTLAIDLAADPSDDEPRVVGLAPDDPEDPAHLLVTGPLRRAAARAPLAAPGDRQADLTGGSYWTGGGASPTVLSREENARLPSPYDRMEILREMDRGRSLLARPGLATEAVFVFAGVRKADPGNPQAAFWHGRALERIVVLGALPLAAEAYRDAFEAGLTTADCVAKALQAGYRAATEQGAEDEVAAGLAFLETALGRGVRANGAVWIFAALLSIEGGDRTAAAEALQRAESEPRTEWLEDALDGVRHRLSE